MNGITNSNIVTISDIYNPRIVQSAPAQLHRPGSTDNGHAPMTASTLADRNTDNILNINQDAFTNMTLRSVRTTISNRVSVPFLGACSDTGKISRGEISATTKEGTATA